jgi:hypothetical protein
MWKNALQSTQLFMFTFLPDYLHSTHRIGVLLGFRMSTLGLRSFSLIGLVGRSSSPSESWISMTSFFFFELVTK